MPIGYEVTVYYRDLASEFGPAGQGGIWMEVVANEMLAASIANCPVYGGVLAASHTIDRVGVGAGFFGNQYVANFQIVNWAEYAEYVHNGTHAVEPITAVNADYMVIPPNRGYRRSKRYSVSGQDAQPWLDEACTEVAFRYGATPVSTAF